MRTVKDRGDYWKGSQRCGNQPLASLEPTDEAMEFKGPGAFITIVISSVGGQRCQCRQCRCFPLSVRLSSRTRTHMRRSFKRYQRRPQELNNLPLFYNRPLNCCGFYFNLSRLGLLSVPQYVITGGYHVYLPKPMAAKRAAALAA